MGCNDYGSPLFSYNCFYNNKKFRAIPAFVSHDTVLGSGSSSLVPFTEVVATPGVIVRIINIKLLKIRPDKNGRTRIQSQPLLWF